MPPDISGFIAGHRKGFQPDRIVVDEALEKLSRAINTKRQTKDRLHARWSLLRHPPHPRCGPENACRN